MSTRRPDTDEPFVRTRRRPAGVPLSLALLIGLGGTAGGMIAGGVVGFLAAKRPAAMKATAEDVRGTPGVSPVGGAVVAEPAHFPDIVELYDNNPVAADMKYKGKRVRVLMSVEDIGQRDGRAFVGCRTIAQWSIKPNCLAYIANSADPKLIAAVPRECVMIIEGMVDGRVDDREDRQFGDHYRFHVSLSDCQILESAKDVRLLKLAAPGPAR